MESEASWTDAAIVGLGLLNGLANTWGASATGRAQEAIERENNSIANGRARLAHTIRTLNNNRLLRHGGKQLDSLSRQFSYASDLGARQGFEASIQQYEAAGRAGVNAAAAGLGGALVTAASSVASIAAGRAREYQKVDRANRTYEQLQQMNTVMGDAVRAMDNTAIMPNHTYNYKGAGDTKMASYLLGGLLGMTDFLQRFGSLTPGQNKKVLPVASAAGVPGSSVEGVELPQLGASSFPIAPVAVQGTALAPINIL